MHPVGLICKIIFSKFFIKYFGLDVHLKYNDRRTGSSGFWVRPLDLFNAFTKQFSALFQEDARLVTTGVLVYLNVYPFLKCLLNSVLLDFLCVMMYFSLLVVSFALLI